MAFWPGNGETQTAAAFVLRCHGDVRLDHGGRDCTPKSKKGRALLAILAAEQRPLSRVKLVDLLWSDRQEEQARASLRTLLADLREQLGTDFDHLLVVDRERVALGGSVRTDLSDPTIAPSAGELFEDLDHIDPELDDWLRTERERLSKGSPPAQLHSGTGPHQNSRHLRMWALAAMLVVCLAGALIYYHPWAQQREPVVAVLKFRDLTGKNALLADGIAEELRVHLAHHPTIQVIGRESSESTSLPTENIVEAARQKLRATHVIEGTVLEHDGVPVVSARLMSTEDNRAIWNELLKPQGMSLMRSAIAIAAQMATNINDTLGQGYGRAFEADPAAYAQLFRARQLNGKWNGQSAVEARSLLAPVLVRYPGFVPALALMAESTMRASDHPSFGGPIPLAKARVQALGYADRAIKASPRYGPAYLAKGLALKDTGWELPFLQKAAALSPGTVEIHRQLARALETSGDLEGSLAHHRQAVLLEPLSMRMAAGLEQALGISGRRAEIPRLVADFARRSDNPHDVLRLIQIASFDTGDLSTGYVAGTEALRIDPEDWIASNNLMTMDVWLGRRERALIRSKEAGMDSSGWTTLLISRDIDGIERKMGSMGQEFWFTSWAREDAAELLVMNGRSSALVRAYDETRRLTKGQQPEPQFIPGAMISAIEDVRGPTEAKRLLEKIKPDWIKLARSYPPGRKALYHAYIAGYAGDDRRALQLLKTALSDHWTNLDLALVPIEKVSAFRRLHKHPEFQRLIGTYYANIDREGRELAMELSRYGRRPIQPTDLIERLSQR